MLLYIPYISYILYCFYIKFRGPARKLIIYYLFTLTAYPLWGAICICSTQISSNSILFIFKIVNGPLGPLALTDLARLPGLLCLGSAELVLPCSLPCFALPRPPASLIREAALRAASTKGGRRPSAAAPPLWIPL